MLDEKYIIERIRNICEKKNMTMYALSKKTGISQSSLSNLMNRESIPTFYTLNKICDGLGITLSQFFAEDTVRLDLSEEQKTVLDTWDLLTDEAKKAVKTYVRGINLK